MSWQNSFTPGCSVPIGAIRHVQCLDCKVDFETACRQKVRCESCQKKRIAQKGKAYNQKLKEKNRRLRAEARNPSAQS